MICANKVYQSCAVANTVYTIVTGQGGRCILIGSLCLVNTTANAAYVILTTSHAGEDWIRTIVPAGSSKEIGLPGTRIPFSYGNLRVQSNVAGVELLATYALAPDMTQP